MKADKNNKKLDELIFKTVGREKPTFDFDKWKENHREEIQIYQSQITEQQSSRSVRIFKIGRPIMKSSIIRFAAAAVIIIISLLLVLNFIGGTGPNSVAYGISDVPGLLRNANTLHVKGSRTYHLKGQKPISCPMEYWMDFENLRYRRKSVYRGSTRNGRYADNYSEHEVVFDTKYIMIIEHTNKTVRFYRYTPFLSRFRLDHPDRDVVLSEFYLKTNQLEGFEKTGQEKIDRIMFDIWEKREDGPTQRITKYWMHPSTGQLGRYFQRFLYDRYFSEEKAEDDKYRDPYVSLNEDEHEWHEHLLTCIERNKPLPDDIFKLEPPNGYTVTISKDEAPDARVGYSTVPDAPNMTVSLRYTLSEDGSVIVAWSDRSDAPPESQTALFEGLEPGDPLPELTFVPYALHPRFSVYRKENESIKHVGRHLTHTKKGNVHYEWSIYVPDSKPPMKDDFNNVVTYDALIRRNPDDGQLRGMGLIPDAIIGSAQDFDALVLGGMAQLSDDGRPPEGITYESVLELAHKIRESFSN